MVVTLIKKWVIGSVFLVGTSRLIFCIISFGYTSSYITCCVARVKVKVFSNDNDASHYCGKDISILMVTLCLVKSNLTLGLNVNHSL